MRGCGTIMGGVELSIFQLNSGGSITRLISSVEIRRLRRLLLEHLTPSTKLYFHDHWTALKIKIRELFVRTFTTKYLN